MTGDLETARDNLAFMRRLVETSEKPSGALGLILLIAGLLYGLQTLVQWADASGLITLTKPVYLGFVIAISVIFVAILLIVSFKTPQSKPRTQAGRAMEAGFMAAGLVNATLVIIFALQAYRSQSSEGWYLYPTIVCALQGGAWVIAYRMRQKLWLLAIALGWFLSAIALALTIATSLYILIMTFALLAFMALPGAILIQLARR